MGQNGNGRVRGWVLIQADKPKEFAQGLYEDLGKVGGDEYVLVRADVVEGHTLFNVIVPIDAASREALQGVAEMIGNDYNVSFSIARVSVHNPKPPHDAHGFITAREKALGSNPDDPCVDVGRFPKSPGHNAWG